MKKEHYQNELSAFVNHELAPGERQLVAEHLLVCAGCRAAHDDIKFAAGLAAGLPQSDAPAYLWNRIDEAVAAGETSGSPSFAFFDLRMVSAALLVVIAIGLAAFVRFGAKDESADSARQEKVATNEPVREPAAAVTAPSVVPVETPAVAIDEIPESVVGKDDRPAPIIVENNAKTPFAPVQRLKKGPTGIPRASWSVETLAGRPQIGDSASVTDLKVGELLETDENSRARVNVADIGNVEVAPNSRVRLVTTKSTEHRLSLERGSLHARIFAPPRLFIVDTPTATAVDLGCEYTLEVDENGDSRLHVTGGFVALENGEFESIVPAGASALTRKGKGIGTPFADKATEKFKAAVFDFDFNDGGAAAIDGILAEASKADSLTLWHLIPRVEEADRLRVIDALAARVSRPPKVTRDGVMKLDRKMLERWWAEVENVWFDDPDNR